MKSSRSNILLVIFLLYSISSFMAPVITHKNVPLMTTDSYIDSDKINLQESKITSSNAFSSFYNFLTQFNNSTEPEKAGLIDDYILWQETDGGGFPAILNESHVVFIYYNTSSTIEFCEIIGDFSAHNAINMTRLDANFSFFYYELSNNFLQFPHTSFVFKIEPTTRIDYFFLINGEEDLYTDPRNPHVSPSSFGRNSSELAMPLFQQPLEIIHRPGIPHGTLTTLQVPWDNPNVQVYLPPNYYPSGNYPTMYTGDGSYYVTLMSAVEILDNMIADQRIEPIIAVFIDHKDADPTDPNDVFTRLEWYNCNSEYLTYLDNLVAYIDENYATNPSPYARLHLGFSISALASAYVALERSETFKLFASQSGSYPIGESSYELMTKFTNAPISLDLKPWFSVGTYENNNNFGSPMVNTTMNMTSICTAKGWSVEVNYNPECHSFGAWRHLLDEMLEYFFSDPITKTMPTSSQTHTGTEHSGTQYTTSTATISIIQEKTNFLLVFVFLPLLLLVFSRKRKSK